MRNSLSVDVSPTYQTVEAYHKHLLAEMEALASGTTGSSSATTATPLTSPTKLKELRAGQGHPPGTPSSTATMSPASPTLSDEKERMAKRAATLCRCFGKTQKGCVRGAKCPFKHSWDGVESKHRCLACGGKGHLAKECPTKKNATAKSAARAPSATPDPAARSVRVDESKNQVVEVPVATSTATPAATSSASSQASELREVLNEAGKMLKALSATQAKACKVVNPLEDRIYQFDEASMAVEKRVKGIEEESMGLLDSGASHPLRPGSTDEVNGCSKVTVTLAGDGTTQLAQNQVGTILIPQDRAEGVQPIVPLEALIMDLGCSLTWSRSHLKLVHPRHGQLKVELRGRCPEVAVSDALALIRELEEVQLKQLEDQVSTLSARLQMLDQQESRTWDVLLRDFVESGRKDVLWKALMSCPYTKELPDEVKELLAEGFDPTRGQEYVKALPLSRRDRRRLLVSNNWVVHLYAGTAAGDGDPFKLLNKSGRVLLEIDVCSSRLWDMNLVGGIYRCLLWAAAAKKVDDVVGGPPCRTFSALLHRPRPGYPEPARSKEHPHGLPQLDPRRQVQVHRDTALIAKQMLIWNVAFLARSGSFVGFLLEHPADPDTYMKDNSEGEGYPSLWKMKMWERFRETFGMHFISYDQGALGHKAVKPTSNGTNYEALLDLDGMKANRAEMVPATMLPSDALARWAPGLRRRLVKAILGSQSLPIPEGVMNEAMSKKMSADQRELWRQHLLADHQPYRPDCATCINAQATGRPHRKVARKRGFSLAVDLAGPFKHKGRDMDYRDYRYLMVAAFRFPRSLLHVTKPKEYDELLEIPEEEDDDMNLAELFAFEEWGFRRGGGS